MEDDFFKQYGKRLVNLGDESIHQFDVGRHYGLAGWITIEDLYQQFKARMMKELTADGIANQGSPA